MTPSRQELGCPPRLPRQVRARHGCDRLSGVTKALTEADTGYPTEETGYVGLLLSGPGKCRAATGSHVRGLPTLAKRQSWEAKRPAVYRSAEDITILESSPSLVYHYPRVDTSETGTGR